MGAPAKQRPVLIAEPWPEQFPRTQAAREELIDHLRSRALAHPLTRTIDTFFLHPSLPVDIRHNAKIFREKLAIWAAAGLKPGRREERRER